MLGAGIGRCYPSACFALRLKIESDLSRNCPGRYVVRAAEGGQEIIERNLVGEVDDTYLRTPSITIAVEQVVMPDGKIEEMSRRDPRRIFVVVLRIGPRYM